MPGAGGLGSGAAASSSFFSSSSFSVGRGLEELPRLRAALSRPARCRSQLGLGGCGSASPPGAAPCPSWAVLGPLPGDPGLKNRSDWRQLSLRFLGKVPEKFKSAGVMSRRTRSYHVKTGRLRISGSLLARCPVLSSHHLPLPRRCFLLEKDVCG